MTSQALYILTPGDHCSIKSHSILLETSFSYTASSKHFASVSLLRLFLQSGMTFFCQLPMLGEILLICEVLAQVHHSQYLPQPLSQEPRHLPLRTISLTCKVREKYLPSEPGGVLTGPGSSAFHTLWLPSLLVLQFASALFLLQLPIHSREKRGEEATRGMAPA